MTPARLVLAVLACALGWCAAARAGALAQEAPDFAARASALVERSVAAGVFSGAVIVARDGRPLFRRAYGPANREWGIPNAVDTRFRIGSITKQFTAAAILRLAEEGRLGLDDPVSRHMPGLPAAWTPVTIRMLLNHSSGIPNVTALPTYQAKISRIARTPEEVVALLFPEDLVFAPGTGHSYSNTGYVLLAALVERVAGRPFDRYLADTLLAPLGLRDTGDGGAGPVLERRASGYRHALGVWRNAEPLAAGVASGAGTLASTLDDLVAWDAALLSGRVVSAASRAAMFTDYGHGYGLGWYIGTAYGRRLWSHGGFVNGFVAIKDTYPDPGLTIAVLGNTETAPAQTLSRALAGLYFGSADPAQAVRVGEAVLERYVGFYRTGRRTLLGVTRAGAGLLLREIGQPPRALVPESDTTFVAAGDAARVTFDIEPDGHPTGLVLHRDGRDRFGPAVAAPARRPGAPCPAGHASDAR